MKTLKYKGYIGSIDYSEDDGVLFGEILGIDGLVSSILSFAKNTTGSHKRVTRAPSTSASPPIPIGTSQTWPQRPASQSMLL